LKGSKPSFKELLDKGEIIEVTSIGAVCGLDEYEYCVRVKCSHWDEEKNCCGRFIWISVVYKGKYYTLMMLRDKAKDNLRLARYLK